MQWSWHCRENSRWVFPLQQKNGGLKWPNKFLISIFDDLENVLGFDVTYAFETFLVDQEETVEYGIWAYRKSSINPPLFC